MRALLCAVAAGATVVAQGVPPAQPPRDSRTTHQAGVGRLVGRVAAADTQQPVRWALLTLTMLERQFVAKATSDAEGRYSFAGLTAGSYILAASKGGFVTQTHGASRRRDTPVPIVVTSGGTTTTDVTLRPAGAIQGRITSETGDPAYDVVVQAFRSGYDAAGPRLIPVAAVSRTDDQGHFRLHSLPAGRYFVEASPPPETGADDPLERSQRLRPSARTFHPGTPRLSEAASIAVEPGRTATLTFSVSSVEVASWTGKVEDSQGRPPNGMAAMLRLRGGPRVGGLSLGGANNQFGFSAVPPGDYILGVVLKTTESVPQFAVRHFTMSGQDVAAPAFRTVPGITLRGKLEIESAPTILPPSGLGIMAVSTLFPGILGDPNGRHQPVRVAPDGTFTFEHLFGLRLFRIQAGPTWALKAVVLGEEDITDTGAEIGATTDGKSLRVIVTNRTGSLSGSVETAGESPDGQVVVFSDNEKVWGSESRFTRVADVRRDGRFDIKGLLPGRYFAAYAADLEPDSWSDPEVLRDLRARAMAAEIVEGADTPVLLKGASTR